MGLFENLFGSTPEDRGNVTESASWIPLTTLEQLEEITAKSSVKPQLIFKHSATCGISRMVLNRFKENLALFKDQMDFYFLDLHSYRAVSQEVGVRFQVLHQSPQVLVIKNGITVAHASHGSIPQMDFRKYV
ncbi:MAG: bacillithiol system redox-active protein YtxJ [Bacteroidota bacterium]